MIPFFPLSDALIRNQALARSSHRAVWTPRFLGSHCSDHLRVRIMNHDKETDEEMNEYIIYIYIHIDNYTI